jgi:hypothetical protein
VFYFLTLNLAFLSKDMESKGTILLSKVQKVQPAGPNIKKKFAFEVISSERSFPIVAESEKEMKDWMDAINIVNALHNLRFVFTRMPNLKLYT